MELNYHKCKSLLDGGPQALTQIGEKSSHMLLSHGAIVLLSCLIGMYTNSLGHRLMWDVASVLEEASTELTGYKTMFLSTIGKMITRKFYAQGMAELS